MAQQPHFFFALSLPPETKHAIKELCEKLKKEYSFSRWVHELDYHITLAFLGSANEDQLQQAKLLVGENLAEAGAFSLTIHQLGIFGREDSPRIFWVGLQNNERLGHVREKVYSSCEIAGFRLDTRPFRPHITLARKWQGDKPFPQEKFETEKNLKDPLSFIAKEIVLYETHLERLPKYEAIASFPLISNDKK
jgi:2'-5' RNA ligase